MAIENTKTGAKADVKSALDTVYRLRDELKVRLHLAGMDVKDAWNRLEPSVNELEKLAEDAPEKAQQVIRNATNELEKLVASLKKPS